MDELLFFLRVIVAGVCGIAIGYERKSRAKEAGIRTHCIVACAASLMIIVSKYGFFDLIQQGIFEGTDVKLDPSRIASCIVSGVGFLGAGMIFVQKQTIKGLTTAAGIWATAGIGMAIGAGLYIIGILVTVLILFAQFILHKDSKFLSVPHYKLVTVKNVSQTGFQEELYNKLKALDITVEDITVSRSADKAYNYLLTIEIPPSVKEEDIVSLTDFESSLITLR